MQYSNSTSVGHAAEWLSAKTGERWTTAQVIERLIEIGPDRIGVMLPPGWALIRAADGTPVTTVDLSRLLREFPLLLHEFVQHADRSCELVARIIPGAYVDAAEMTAALRRVLGGVPLKVRFDSTLGDRSEGKAMPYRSDLMLEE